MGSAESGAPIVLGIEPGASELVTEPAPALEVVAPGADLKRLVHAHPVLSERVVEAAERFYSEAIPLPD